MNGLALVIIEDKPSAQEFSERLMETGLSVLTAVSTAKALELAESASPDIVFLDIELAMDTKDADFYRMIVEGKATDHAPVIITEPATSKGPAFKLNINELPPTVHGIISLYATADRIRSAIASAVTQSPRYIE